MENYMKRFSGFNHQPTGPNADGGPRGNSPQDAVVGREIIELYIPRGDGGGGIIRGGGGGGRPTRTKDDRKISLVPHTDRTTKTIVNFLAWATRCFFVLWAIYPIFRDRSSLLNISYHLVQLV